MEERAQGEPRGPSSDGVDCAGCQKTLRLDRRNNARYATPIFE